MFANTPTLHMFSLFTLQELQVNSFEQLCINYANETLQFFFNRVIFQEEQVRETIKYLQIFTLRMDLHLKRHELTELKLE